MTGWKRVVAPVAGLLACAWAWTGYNSRAVETELPEELVYYTSVRPALWDIFVADELGRGARRVAPHPALDYEPALSPDGRWLVFVSDRDGDPDLYLADLDQPQAQPLQLTDNLWAEDQPAFSPDGARLAWMSDQGGVAGIFNARFQPSSDEPLQDVARVAPDHARPLFRPAYSPDGARLAVVAQSPDEEVPGSIVSGAGQIAVIDIAQGFVKSLTRQHGWDASPAWSPDGEWIYFHRFVGHMGGGKARIWKVEVETGREEPVSASEGNFSEPHFDSQGRLVAVQGTMRQPQEMPFPYLSRDVVVFEEGESRVLYRDRWALDLASSGRAAMVGHGPEVPPDAVEGPLGRYPILPEVDEVRRLPDRKIRLRALRFPYPRISPDGSTCLFSFPEAGLYSMNLESGRLDGRLLAGQMLWSAEWAPKGDRIVVALGPVFAPHNAPVDIWTMAPDGSDRRNLTADSPANDNEPQFSRDGSQIVFRSGRDGNFEIYTMTADGRRPTRLTNHPATDRHPTFSPDGRQVAFTSTRHGDYEIYTLDLDEKGRPGAVRRITESPGHDTHPAYSPDGKWLIISSQRGGYIDQQPLWMNPQPYGDLYAIRLADLHVVRLTDNKWEDGLAAWAPTP